MKKREPEPEMKRIAKVIKEVEALFTNGKEPPKRVAWRMPEKCADCPFHTRGAGLSLRKALRRWDEILDELRAGNYFPCHQTAHGEEDDEGEYVYSGKELVCAGSIEWQDANGASSAYVRICRAADRKERRHGKRRS